MFQTKKVSIEDFLSKIVENVKVVLGDKFPAPRKCIYYTIDDIPPNPPGYVLLRQEAKGERPIFMQVNVDEFIESMRKFPPEELLTWHEVIRESDYCDLQFDIDVSEEDRKGWTNVKEFVHSVCTPIIKEVQKTFTPSLLKEFNVKDPSAVVFLKKDLHYTIETSCREGKKWSLHLKFKNFKCTNRQKVQLNSVGILQKLLSLDGGKFWKKKNGEFLIDLNVFKSLRTLYSVKVEEPDRPLGLWEETQSNSNFNIQKWKNSLLTYIDPVPPKDSCFFLCQHFDSLQEKILPSLKESGLYNYIEKGKKDHNELNGTKKKPSSFTQVRCGLFLTDVIGRWTLKVIPYYYQRFWTLEPVNFSKLLVKSVNIRTLVFNGEKKESYVVITSGLPCIQREICMRDRHTKEVRDSQWIVSPSFDRIRFCCFSHKCQGKALSDQEKEKRKLTLNPISYANILIPDVQEKSLETLFEEFDLGKLKSGRSEEIPLITRSFDSFFEEEKEKETVPSKSNDDDIIVIEEEDEDDIISKNTSSSNDSSNSSGNGKKRIYDTESRNFVEKESQQIQFPNVLPRPPSLTIPKPSLSTGNSPVLASSRGKQSSSPNSTSSSSNSFGSSNEDDSNSRGFKISHTKQNASLYFDEKTQSNFMNISEIMGVLSVEERQKNKKKKKETSKSSERSVSDVIDLDDFDGPINLDD